jgi:hypothetical protein
MEGYHPNAPMEAISDNVYYDSQAQQNHQANEYTYHNQSNQTYLPPPPQFTSVNDTTRFPGLHLPYPNQLQDTRSMPQYDNRDLTPWSSRMSGGVQAETSPPIAQLIHHSFEPSHEEYPPMSRSHRYKMPRLPQELQQKQENEPQAKARPETHRNLVGTPGFPKPRPECEFKQKFTSEDDEVLKKLKHNFRDPFRAGSKDDSLTWWQIADFFPGRAPGTLQVHYCKEVSAKGPVWTEDLVRISLDRYSNSKC